MTESPLVFDATRENFETEVIARSQQLPILVDFWAEWCAPCRMLAPVLERLAAAYEGRIRVAKVDTDREPDLAARYAIRALPSVVIFRHGGAAERFSGVQPLEAVRAVIERYLEPNAGDPVREARDALAQGRPALARELFEQILADSPQRHELRIELATALVGLGELDRAEQIVASLPANFAETAPARRLRARLYFARIAAQAQSVKELEAQVARAPDDLDARLALGALHLLLGNGKAGLEEFAEIMRRDRTFQDDIGRKSLLAAFEWLGEEDANVAVYRRKMATLLY